MHKGFSASRSVRGAGAGRGTTAQGLPTMGCREPTGGSPASRRIQRPHGGGGGGGEPQPLELKTDNSIFCHFSKGVISTMRCLLGRLFTPYEHVLVLVPNRSGGEFSAAPCEPAQRENSNKNSVRATRSPPSTGGT